MGMSLKPSSNRAWVAAFTLVVSGLCHSMFRVVHGTFPRNMPFRELGFGCGARLVVWELNFDGFWSVSGASGCFLALVCFAQMHVGHESSTDVVDVKFGTPFIASDASCKCLSHGCPSCWYHKSFLVCFFTHCVFIKDGLDQTPECNGHLSALAIESCICCACTVIRCCLSLFLHVKRQCRGLFPRCFHGVVHFCMWVILI